MYRSIAVDAGTPAAAFVTALQQNLDRFGRDDAILVSVGKLTLFIWEPNFKAVGSPALRKASLDARMAGQKAKLQALEVALPAGHFDPFDIDFDQIDPEIVPCVRKSPDETLFDYVARGQSIAAETSKMRIGKFLIYDRSRAPRRLAGVMGLKSPMYFDGARDRHLGWPPLFNMVADVWVKNQAAVALRNVALKSVFNICVCMAASPYDQPRVGKLIASLAFSPPVIDYLEQTYNDPVLGMTTTGGWGGSAGQYERIRVATPLVANGPKQKLFARTHGVKTSLNFPLHLFDSGVFDSAFRALQASSQPSRPFADYKNDQKVQRALLMAACGLVGLPWRAIATNVVAHYFGAASQACRDALATAQTLAAPPAARTVPIADIVAEWRNQPLPSPLKGVSATLLSTLAN